MIQIFDFDQNSPEWFQARAGIPTASEFHTVMASGRSGGESKTRKTYMYKLAGEVVTGEPTEGYSNAHMDRGHVMEEEARDKYSFIADAEIQRVGFIRNGDKGASPDGLIGDRGMFEAKSKLPHLLIETLFRDDFPPEHKAQCQGALWVAEREWIDIVVYWPKLPLFVKRAYRDEAYIAGIATAVKQFNEELAEVVDKVRRYGVPPVPVNQNDLDAIRNHPLMAG
ncbi:MAG: YqaJ viral recombinase family protein [Rhizobiales bacterium]|nr:YqaJ viral recombinase family protein [Hyphomicrobiales bacterium]